MSSALPTFVTKAIDDGDVEVVRNYLIAHPFMVHARDKSDGKVPLERAVENDNHDMAVMLIGQGANPLDTETKGRDMIASAIVNGNLQLVMRLGFYPENINIKSIYKAARAINKTRRDTDLLECYQILVYILKEYVKNNGEEAMKNVILSKKNIDNFHPFKTYAKKCWGKLMDEFGIGGEVVVVPAPVPAAAAVAAVAAVAPVGNAVDGRDAAALLLPAPAAAVEDEVAAARPHAAAQAAAVDAPAVVVVAAMPVVAPVQGGNGMNRRRRSAVGDEENQPPLDGNVMYVEGGHDPKRGPDAAWDAQSQGGADANKRRRVGGEGELDGEASEHSEGPDDAYAEYDVEDPLMDDFGIGGEVVVVPAPVTAVAAAMASPGNAVDARDAAALHLPAPDAAVVDEVAAARPHAAAVVARPAETGGNVRRARLAVFPWPSLRTLNERSVRVVWPSDTQQP